MTSLHWEPVLFANAAEWLPVGRPFPAFLRSFLIGVLDLLYRSQVLETASVAFILAPGLQATNELVPPPHEQQHEWGKAEERMRKDWGKTWSPNRGHSPHTHCRVPPNTSGNRTGSRGAAAAVEGANGAPRLLLALVLVLVLMSM